MTTHLNPSILHIKSNAMKSKYAILTGVIFTLLSAPLWGQVSNDESKRERGYLQVPELVFKDSLFFQRIDSLVFNSICFNLHKLDKGNFEVCYVDSEEPWLRFDLYPEFEFRGGTITGYFEYKNFSFVWYGVIPDSLCEISDRKREFSYWKGENGDSVISVYLGYVEGSIQSMGMDCPDLDMQRSFYDED